jgi:hypothetical protein
MNEYIFTFGYGQNPGIGYFVVIKADNEGEARTKMKKAYGDRWSFCYSSRDKAGVDKYNLKEITLSE